MPVVRPSFLIAVAVLLLPSDSAAQSTANTSQAASQQTAAPDPDLQPKPADPDFTLSALPTALRMPAGKFSFRLTPRFSRPIASCSAGEFIGERFGLERLSPVGP